MRLWELAVQIYALISLPVDAEKSRSSDVAKIIVQTDDPQIKNAIQFERSVLPFSVPDETENSHDTPARSETSNADGFLRSLRGRDSFIRFGRGRNDNFMRFGRGKQDNFMRFGRSNDVEKEPDKETVEYDRFMRSGKGNKKSVNEKFERLTKNFIRLGRGKQDNFMRFGRGKQDNFMRLGRGKQDNFMRFGRGKQDNFMRFGKGKQDNFMRLGRGKQDNFMRFGRGKPGNFMRFGRGNQGNFMRFGRGKESNYMRSGRDMENSDLISLKDNLVVNGIFGNTKGKYDSFGRHTDSFFDNIPIAMRSTPSKFNSFDNFGKPDPDQQPSPSLEFSEDTNNNLSFNPDNTIHLDDTFTRVIKSKINDGVNLLRQGRHPPNKDDSFIRFGRNPQDSSSTNLMPQRLKRSTVELDECQEDILPSKFHEEIKNQIPLPGFSVTDYYDEDLYSSDHLDGYNSRKKRSVKPSPLFPYSDRISFMDDVSSKMLVDSGKVPNLFVIPLFFTPTSSSFSSEE